MTANANLEREIKLDLTSSVSLPDLASFELIGERRIVLDATYWDTADLRLLWLGHTVRHRVASDGAEDGWTMKLASPSGDATERLELSVAGDLAVVPAEILALLRGIVVDEPLVPVAQIVTTRWARQLRDPDDASEIELADDEVRSQVGGRTGPSFRQVEVEVLSGGAKARALRTAVKTLKRSGATPSFYDSKLRQVLEGAVLEGAVLEGAIPDGSRRSIDPADAPVGRRARVDDLVCRAIGDGVGRLLLNDPAIRFVGGVEAIHQARVATRRLRSDLQTLAPALDPVHVQILRGELSWLGGLLGAVRDADVMHETLTVALGDIDATVDSGSDPARGGRILRLLVEQRALAHLTVVDAMTSSRYLTLTDQLLRARDTPPLRPGIGTRRARRFGEKAMTSAYHRVAKAVRALPAEPPAAQLHDLRKRAKRARYAAELMAPLTLDRSAALADGMAELQTVLGEHQDLVVARAWLRTLPAAPLPAADVFLAGQLHQYLGQRCERPVCWKPAWRRARAHKPA
jgi:CHAD domain-containing protein